MTRAYGAALVLLVATGCFSAPNTAAPPGVPGKFDPVGSFAAMATFAGPQARVMSLRADHVKPDGTMDLTVDGTKVEAEFVAAAIEGDPQIQPEAGFAVGHAIRVKLSVQAPHTRHVVENGSEWDEKHRGMERAPNGRASGDETTLEPPACTYATLWQKAIEQGAAREGAATIVYDADGYTFTVGEVERRFKSDCAPVADRRRGKKK